MPMIPRCTEPELMDDPKQARAYAKADFSQPHSDIVRCFQQTFPSLPPESKLIDLGCGSADISIRMAGLYPKFSIDALDGSDAMLSEATRMLSEKNLDSRIRLIKTVLPDLSALSSTNYDIVISNSLLHHLHDPQTLWETVKSVAGKHTYVFISDLRRPDSEAEARLLTEKYAASEPQILQRDFYQSLLAAFIPEELRTQILEAGLELDIRTRGDRHVILSGEIGEECRSA